MMVEVMGHTLLELACPVEVLRRVVEMRVHVVSSGLQAGKQVDRDAGKQVFWY